MFMTNIELQKKYWSRLGEPKKKKKNPETAQQPSFCVFYISGIIMLESDHREQRSNRDEDMVGSKGITRGSKKKKKKKEMYQKSAAIICHGCPPPSAPLL